MSANRALLILRACLRWVGTACTRDQWRVANPNYQVEVPHDPDVNLHPRRTRFESGAHRCFGRCRAGPPLDRLVPAADDCAGIGA